jgi:hypothetical protein
MQCRSASLLLTEAAFAQDLGVSTGKNLEDSDWVIMKAKQWVILYLSTSYDRYY